MKENKLNKKETYKKLWLTITPDKLEKKQKYQREWLRERRNSWIKENGPCQKCGTWSDPEIDHINPALKKIDADKLWCRRIEIRQEELKNCQVLCKKCHLEKTIQERPKRTLVHGTISAYRHFKCRCSHCKSSETKRRMKYKNPNRYKELYESQ